MTRFVPVEELFKGRHFDREIVVLCVRWYLSFKLSYRDLVTMMLERGIELAHTTILRWVQHYTPVFEKRWNRYARSVGGSWRCDETYVKVKGAWVGSGANLGLGHTSGRICPVRLRVTRVMRPARLARSLPSSPSVHRVYRTYTALS